MNKIIISDTEFLYFINEEWDNNIQRGFGEIWLTTKAFQKVLEEKGIIMSWQSVDSRMHKYLDMGRLELIRSSAGECWKPLGEYIV